MPKQNKENNFLSVVVYVHNNEKILENFLRKINHIVSKRFKSYEIICVNDNSSDKSKEIIKKIAQKSESAMISIINMSFYQGLESSMIAGVDLAIGDFVIEFDLVDDKIDLSLINKIYDRSLQGYDIVSVTSPYSSSFLSSIYYKFFNKFSKNQYNIKTEFFRILSRRGINRVKSLGITIPYRKALYTNCGLKVDYIEAETKKNKIQKNLEENFDTAVTSLIIFTNVAYKVAIFISLAFMLLTVFSTLYVLTVFILGNPVPGYTSLLLLISASFFGLFLLLTIIIKYLTVLVNLIYKRQNYLIESIEKVSAK